MQSHWRYFERVSVHDRTVSRARTLGLAVLCGFAASAAAGLAFLCHFNLSTAGSIEILLVVLVALRWGFFQSTVVSFVSLACLNYLFTAPLFHFSVSDPQNLVSLATFEATAILVSRRSSKVHLHAAEVEVERKRNLKLYELSRAILLIDVRASTSPQVEELVRQLIAVEEVEIWSAYDMDDVGISRPNAMKKGEAYQAYIAGKDSEDLTHRNTARLLQIGTTVIGAIALKGWNCDAPLADAVASLVAVALERSRAVRKENRAEAERRTEQLRTAVLDGLAHSYKTPLTAIQTASSGLLAIRQMTPTQTELVSIIDDQVTVLSKLTTRLLQTAALEGKEVRLRRQNIQMSAFVNEVIEMQDDGMRSRLSVSVPANLLPISMDAELMRLAFIQFLDNAAKYAAIGPLIKVSVVQDQAETLLTVANEGPPIPVEERERIFHRFYRGPDAGRGPTGTGLGLSIVKKAAEAHGGRAWVEARDGFNCFSLSIPHFTGSNR